MVDIEKTKVSMPAKLLGGLLGGSIVTTWGVAWYVWSYTQAEREARQLEREADRTSVSASLEGVRDEVAEIGDAVSVQANEMKWIRELVTELRSEIRRQETNTASELREVRADIRALNGDKPGGGK